MNKVYTGVILLMLSSQVSAFCSTLDSLLFILTFGTAHCVPDDFMVEKPNPKPEPKEEQPPFEYRPGPVQDGPNVAFPVTELEGLALQRVLPFCRVSLTHYEQRKNNPSHHREKRRVENPLRHCVDPLLSVVMLYLSLPLEQSLQSVRAIVSSALLGNNDESLLQNAVVLRRLSSEEQATVRHLGDAIRESPLRVEALEGLIFDALLNRASVALNPVGHQSYILSRATTYDAPPVVDLRVHHAGDGYTYTQGEEYTIDTVVLRPHEPTANVARLDPLRRILRTWRDAIPDHLFGRERQQRELLRIAREFLSEEGLDLVLSDANGDATLVYVVASYHGIPIGMTGARINEAGFYYDLGTFTDYANIITLQHDSRHIDLYDTLLSAIAFAAYQEGGHTRLVFRLT